MASVLNKSTKQYIDSVNTPDYLDGSWIINPDLSAVMGQPMKYWIIEGETLRLATEAEQAEIDANIGFAGLTVDQAKEVQYNRINMYRENMIGMGAVMKSTLFDSDSAARENISGICNAIALGYRVPSDFTWRNHYNQNIPFTTVDCTTLGIGLMGFVGQIYGTSWYHKDTIKAIASTNIEDIVNYNWHTGWPANSLDGTSLPTA